MVQETIKTTVVVTLVIVAGSLVASLNVVEGAELLEWTVAELVRLAVFGVAAGLVFDLGLQLGDRQARPVMGSGALSSLVMLLAWALGTYFLYIGVGEVLQPTWQNTLDVIFALAMVALAGAVVWRVYVGFEEIVQVLKRARSSRQKATEADRARRGPTSSAKETPVQAEEFGGDGAGAGFCTSCGAEYDVEQSYCGSCGSRLQQ